MPRPAPAGAGHRAVWGWGVRSFRLTIPARPTYDRVCPHPCRMPGHGAAICGTRSWVAGCGMWDAVCGTRVEGAGRVVGRRTRSGGRKGGSSPGSEACSSAVESGSVRAGAATLEHGSASPTSSLAPRFLPRPRRAAGGGDARAPSRLRPGGAVSWHPLAFAGRSSRSPRAVSAICAAVGAGAVLQP